MSCPQRRDQPLQAWGGFSPTQGDPLSALSESLVSETPGRTLLGAGPWDTPNLTSQKANKTAKMCSLLCVFMSSWRPLGSPSAWGYWLAEGAPRRQCFCPWHVTWLLVCGGCYECAEWIMTRAFLY